MDIPSLISSGGVVTVGEPEIVPAVASGTEDGAGVVLHVRFDGLIKRGPGVGSFGKLHPHHHPAVRTAPLAARTEVLSQRGQHGVPFQLQGCPDPLDVAIAVSAEVAVDCHCGQVARRGTEAVACQCLSDLNRGRRRSRVSGRSPAASYRPRRR